MCENEKKKYHSIEMTTGSLWKNILLFSLPLMGSQVLEVLFNLSDVAVVGRFADYVALGARRLHNFAGYSVYRNPYRNGCRCQCPRSSRTGCR